TLGTGGGSGLIVNGGLVRGATCSAGGLGQTSIDYRGRLGHYGNRGALEDYVGNREIAAGARTLYARPGIDKAIVDCNPIALERAALAGDEVAAQVWRDLAVKLSCALMNCCYLLNPQAIITGGGGAKAKPLLSQPLQEIMRAQLAAPLVEQLEILPAQFGTEAGILGSAHLALNTHFGETFRA
ncbi:ROK family protein, partial [uncultured Akkermansia sp.]|uniref:ROK family protein n=1 Tax=uncultured Akkermansia sp. TaxID=512294 RepID=UPI0025EB87DD